MEDVNALSEVAGTLHCGVDPGSPCNETTGQGSGLVSCSGCQAGYNTYSVIVNRTNASDESITWYLNGTAYHTATESQIGTSAWQAAVDYGFFLILDVAIGGVFPNGVCNCTTPASTTSSGAAMSVGHVAVYQTSGSGSGGGVGVAAGKSCTAPATADISADCYTGSQGTIDVTSTADSDPSGVARPGRPAGQPWNTAASTSDPDRAQLDTRVASGAVGGVSGLVELVLDNPANTPVGSFAVANTGGWTSWRTIAANISTVTGTHIVYLEFSSGAGGDPPFVSLHYFDSGFLFSRSKLRPWLRSVAGCTTRARSASSRPGSTPMPTACTTWSGRSPPGSNAPSATALGGRRTGDRRIMRAAAGTGTSATACTIFNKTRTPLTGWFTACWSFATAKDGISAPSLQWSLEIAPTRWRGRRWPVPLAAGSPGPQAAERHGGGG